MSAARHGIVTFDQQAVIQVVNDAAQEIFAYSAAEMVGQPASLLVDALDAARIVELLASIVAGGREDTHELTGRRQGGETFALELALTAATVRGEARAFAIVEDLTERRRAEADLINDQHLLQALMTSLPDAIYFKDGESRFVRISRALARKFGLKDPAEAIGKTDATFFTEEHAQQAIVDEQELMRSGDPLLNKEEKETWPGGRATWVSTSKLPLRDDQGNVIGTFGISRDITERKRMEEALRQSEFRTRMIVDSAYDAFVAIDADGLIIDWNLQAKAIFGWSREEAIGRPLQSTIIPQQYREGHYRGLKHFLATGEGPLLNKRIEIVALHRDGHEFPVELTISPVRLPGTFIFSAFIHDITERRRVHAELQKAKEAAEAASRAKSEFLANMSHEIRTPMNGIIGMTELALDTPLSPEQREYLGMVKASADSLLTVINDILDFSKIEARKLLLDSLPFNLRDSLGDATRALALRAQQKGLELACHIPPAVPSVVVGDPGRLRQVVVNMIGNAIKFTDTGEVVVHVETESQSDHQVMLHFAVADTGIGIPEEKRQQIFEAFSQADASTTRKYGGTGLGLTISSQLIDLMGGRIWVESELGHGSTFHFTAKFGLTDELLDDAAERRVTNLHNLQVLVVDDNATNRRIMQEMLSNWGMQPMLVDGGASALAAMRWAAEHQRPFALVLLDGHMPVMDGFQLAAEIKNNPAFSSAAMVMLTSAGQSEDIARCRELGIGAYLMKPIKQSELLDTIFTALGASLRQPQHVPAAIAAHAGRPPLRVLLAEDNAVNQKLASRLLERQGHEVVIAPNGQKAVDLLAQQQFDLVLMDVQMPILDGLEATALIRLSEFGIGRHIPILAMTAHAMKGDRERCLDAGMDGYVSKPIHPQDLFQAIDHVLPPPGEASSSSTATAAHASAHILIDPAAALACVNGDPELLKELVGVFLEDYPIQLSEIRAAIERADRATAQQLAHTIKGAVGTFGAGCAFDAALRLEQIAREAELADVTGACDALESQLTQLAPLLTALARGDLR